MPKHESVFINEVVTPKGRVSFPHLSEPDNRGEYPDDKYKVTLLFEKGTDLSGLKQKIGECVKQAWPNKVIKPKDLAHMPLRDAGDRSHLDGYEEGVITLTAKSTRRVRCVDRSRADIDPSEVYGGCYARAVVSVMSYEQGGKPGVTFLLDLVQKIEEGTPFGKGSASPAILDDGEYADVDGGASGISGWEEGEGPASAEDEDEDSGW